MLTRYTLVLRFVLLSVVLAMGAGCDPTNKSHKSAEIRLLNVSTGYDSLDVLADDENDDDGDSTQLQAVAYGTVSDYAKFDSGTYTLKFKRNGVTGTLRTISSAKLPDDSRTTYIAYGSSGNFAVTSIDEDADDPADGKTLVRVFNAAEGVGTLNVYFTDASDSLENVSPDFSAVGGSSATLDSGTYRLRVTGSGDTDDIRLDIPEITLPDGGIVSLIFTSSQGGVLVNAVMLPHEGELTTITNPRARVRGAVGISSGALTTIRVGGSTLFSNATTGAIGSKYVQVNAGSAAVTLSVDGNLIDTPAQTLVAGGDYTLLAWNDANGTHTTLISDDNRLPSSAGNVKLRLINGMSAFGDPISLAIDYSPIAEGVTLGQASAFASVDSGTDLQLDVTSALTATNVLSKTSVTLVGSGVYTLFMAGGAGSSQVSGILRKDR
ncbi:MAG TPA: DUF4397 domain-containing protein [Povalibacter sp.]|nr:DUF4397 domain-containing protein [Povalibacter sp.]